MTTASEQRRYWSRLAGTLLMLAAVPAMAQMGRQAQMQQHQRNTADYVNWVQGQETGSYIQSAEDAAGAQIRANIQAAENAKIKRDVNRDWWGFVVVDTGNGAWSVELNADTKDQAMIAAMKKCEGVCYPVLSFANSCMAPAYSAQGGMYFSPGEDAAAATVAAVNVCTAAGGTDCQSPPKQAFCTGWKYAYKAVDRFLNRASFTARGKVAEPKYEPFGGAAEFIAKPLDKRGTSTGVANTGVAPKGSMAQPWTAIAAGADRKAYSLHMGVNERDARDTAMKKCGSADCKVVAAFTMGQCAAVVRFGRDDGPRSTYGAVAKKADEAVDVVVGQCLDADLPTCPIAFKNCM